MLTGEKLCPVPPPRRINRSAAMTTILLRCFCGGSYSAMYRLGICTAAFPAVGAKRSRLVWTDTIRYFPVCVFPYASSWGTSLILPRKKCTRAFRPPVLSTASPALLLSHTYTLQLCFAPLTIYLRSSFHLLAACRDLLQTLWRRALFFLSEGPLFLVHPHFLFLSKCLDFKVEGGWLLKWGYLER